LQRSRVISRPLLVLVFVWAFMGFCAMGSALDVSPYETLGQENPWDQERLFSPPKTFDPPAVDPMEGVEPVFYEGEPYLGKETRVFAWKGFPQGGADRSVPGMVLVHGGGGTAFAEWVRIWNRRGYAAIAMDTAGCVPRTEGEQSGNPRERHAFAGPPGWGGFDQMEGKPLDHWTYHAVAAILRAHSHLRSLPQVDANRIGITGISWGGYLTCIAAGVDSRFQFAIPVYGCGYYGYSQCYIPRLENLGAKSSEWMRRWDPAQYLHRAKMPFFWVSGPKDLHFPLESLQPSYYLTKGKRDLCLPVDMRHSHVAGWRPQEIYAYADVAFLGKEPLPVVTGSGLKEGEDGKAWVAFQHGGPPQKVLFHWTTDRRVSQDRVWHTEEVAAEKTSPGNYRSEHPVPQDASFLYFNVLDHRGFIVSSEHVVLF